MYAANKILGGLVDVLPELILLGHRHRVMSMVWLLIFPVSR